MDFTALTIQFLKMIADMVGNWGLAIIVLTVIIRLALWPANVSQQKSMKKMQEVQPRIKLIQERYKSNPEMMQQKMMEFWKENKVNPMSGCLPMLIQLPIFILLYSALMSPMFIEQAGNANFLFIKRLDATIRSNAGLSGDGNFQVDGFVRLQSGKFATVYLKDGKVLNDVKISQPQKAVSVQGDITAGTPMDIKLQIDSLNLNFSTLNSIEKVETKVSNAQTRETEDVTFKREGDILMAQVPTIKAAEQIHFDVILLLVLFVLTMVLMQKIMMAAQNTKQDPSQAAIQKSMTTVMPVMITVTFLFVPIPAGVLLYLVTSNIFQIFQTVIINRQIENEDKNKNLKKPSEAVIDAKISKEGE
ncbi:MAG: YidC/Oxa1 family membrane protein insertase [Candidatus Gastranaerophilales bacterium]|nr:YidC/Oxa1 family membrane protein insertase [Candidatus Gastranaerophilales bacterium]